MVLLIRDNLFYMMIIKNFSTIVEFKLLRKLKLYVHFLAGLVISGMLLMEGFQFLMRQGETHTRKCMSIFSSMQILSVELWEVVISLLLLLLL